MRWSVTRGIVILALTGSACVISGPVGPAGASCSVKIGSDGTKAISCTDGSSIVLVDGRDGQDGRDGTGCTVSDRGDGTRLLSCADGTQAVIANGSNGERGPAGPTGATGPAGAVSLVRTTRFESSANCPGGGVRVETGLDDGVGTDDAGAPVSGDGRLDDGEVRGEATVEVCDGLRSLMDLRTLKSGESAECPSGGSLVLIGLDRNGNGRLEAGEVQLTRPLCGPAVDGDDSATLVHLVRHDRAFESCPGGGVTIQFGTDANGSGQLELAEVSRSVPVCDGTAGASARVESVEELFVAACEGPGRTLFFGVDRNGNGALRDAAGAAEPGEVQSSYQVCSAVSKGGQGRAADKWVARAEPKAADGAAPCPTGGTILTIGPDADGDQKPDAGAQTTTLPVCNGEAGVPGPAGASARVESEVSTQLSGCGGPGTLFYFGVDMNGDGRLRSSEGVPQGEEVQSVRQFCERSTSSGDTGSSTGGALLVATREKAADGVLPCPAGGVTLTLAIDADGDGQIAAGEVRSTAALCHGAEGTLGANGLPGADGQDGVDALVYEVPAPDLPGCLEGGRTIYFGVDSDGDGDLLAADGSVSIDEVRASFNVCERPAPICGDGVLNWGEECDHARENADTAECTATCRLARCGDGFVRAGEEQCDAGDANADTGACRRDCKPAVCGDGYIQEVVGERCETYPSSPACAEGCNDAWRVAFEASVDQGRLAELISCLGCVGTSCPVVGAEGIALAPDGNALCVPGMPTSLSKDFRLEFEVRGAATLSSLGFWQAEDRYIRQTPTGEGCASGGGGGSGSGSSGGPRYFSSARYAFERVGGRYRLLGYDAARGLMRDTWCVLPEGLLPLWIGLAGGEGWLDRVRLLVP